MKRSSHLKGILRFFVGPVVDVDDNYFDFLLGLPLPVFLKYEPDGPGNSIIKQLNFQVNSSFGGFGAGFKI
jgi:hypothetical protein